MARFRAILNNIVYRNAVAAAVLAAGLFALALGTATIPSNAHAADGATAGAGSEIVYGQPDAPVTIVEYASLTCPHCANFHTEMLPLLKERLLDTGKAKLVYKDFPLDEFALRAAVMVRCNTGARSRAMLDVLFKTQQSWGRAADPVAALMNIGRAAGMTDKDLEACFNNQAIMDGVIKQRFDAEKQYQVNSTPSFVINGKLYRGGMTIEQFEKAVGDKQP